MAKDTTGRLHVTVKTGGKRKLSSKLWLERQLNDPYVAQAKRDGYRSRAAYKLLEIDDKHHFLKQGLTVVDLGAAPGGWSQIAARRTGAADGKGLGDEFFGGQVKPDGRPRRSPPDREPLAGTARALRHRLCIARL